ncbi:IS3 family transposase, partial [Dyella choica]
MATQHGHAIRTLCRTLHVSPSGYYAWRCREPGSRAQENQRLVQCIQELHAVTREAYGTTRIWKALRQEGEVCGRHRVRRLRQQHAIQTRRRRRYMRTRAPYQRVPAAPNRLAWPFASPGRDRVWVADITY